MLSNYNKKKAKNQVVSQFTEKHVSGKMQKRIIECGDWLQFLADRKVEKLKVHEANFCKNRFCPVCSWRLAKKDAMKISVLMKYIEQEHGKAFVFLTLTAPNVSGEDLGREITKYNKAFKMFMERKEIASINRGYIRKLEITYNAERKDYHPHFHCVIAVDKSYFTSRSYVRRDKWLNHWRELMNDPSITQVDVRRVKKTAKTESDIKTSSAVNELAKYAAKDSDYTHSQEVFDSFYHALKGRQVITYNGLFAKANKMFKAHELDKYLELDTTEYWYLLIYKWGKGEYLEQERRELTDEEYDKFNRWLLEESEVDE